ncbi:WAT1-related protein At5g64700-like [Humulus lupulus]|uniref:WAT1-related protein At5g64700-like n=1 Tax=Humulus lupulus TaxID=3486 RepID=UPI002B40987E|nr:WAT1-related protein At5g64700-like [Humulus lupulus]
MDLGFKKWFKWSQVVLAMLMVQVFSTGMQVLSRVVLVKGTFVFALITYRNVVAALCVAPLAYYFEIRDHEMKFDWQVWFWLFVNALNVVGTTGLFYYGLKDTTATYATNFLNLIPIVTFVVSVITRMERLRLGTKPGKVKTIGALLCVSGAIVTGLYKGKEFFIGHHHDESLSGHNNSSSAMASHSHWARGTILLVVSSLAYSSWFIVQVKLQKLLPYVYLSTMLTCILSSFQSVLLGLCLNTDSIAWSLGWNLQLVTVIYSGILATAVNLCLLSWAISVQGPTYPPMFNPLALIFVAFLEALTLGEPITVGTLMGVVLIIFGLYSFLWGKRKEIKSLSQQKVGFHEVEPVNSNTQLGEKSQTCTVDFGH